MTAEQSVAVVLLSEDADGRTRPLGSPEPLDLADSGDLPPRTVAALLDAAVRLVAPHDITPAITAVLVALDVPAAFRASPWLHEHRAIVLRNNCWVSGDISLRYRKGIGLCVETGDETAEGEGV